MKSRRRLLVLVAALFIFIFVAAVLYQAGMARLEHKPRTMFEALEWAVETISTTGYGRDNHWTNPVMVLLVVTVQLAGMLLVPLVLFLFVLPYIAERFEARLPRQADRRLHDHVVVYRYGPAVEMLLQRLASQNVPTLVAETDEVRAREVLDAGGRLIFSRSDEDVLDFCRLDHAKAVVANGRDEENAGITLRARQMGFRGDIFAFVEDPTHRKAIELAGATAAYTPRHIIAAALAAHASDVISPRLPGLAAVAGLERREMRVPPSSPVAGMTLAEAQVGEKSGAIVVGQWISSHLSTRCSGDMRITGGGVLEVVGDEESLARAAELIGGRYLNQSGPFLVAGFGEVGRKVHELLEDAGEEVRVVERTNAPHVDVVGDVLDSSVLERAGIAQSRAVILALDSDDSTLFATVISRDVAPDIPVIARVNHARNVANIHRAGADFALSISEVSGDMLYSRLVGRPMSGRDEHRRVMRVLMPRWTGRSIRDLPIRSHGCSAVALERDGRFVSRITGDMRCEVGDALWICGAAESVHKITAEA
jgi:Trk K+ transport system NAD-binding subunit